MKTRICTDEINGTVTEYLIRANAFGQGVETARCTVEGGVVRVWDSIAGYYTTCHRLTPSQQGRVRKAAAR